jgi:hypothetical protein
MGYCTVLYFLLRAKIIAITGTLISIGFKGAALARRTSPTFQKVGSSTRDGDSNSNGIQPMKNKNIKYKYSKYCNWMKIIMNQQSCVVIRHWLNFFQLKERIVPPGPHFLTLTTMTAHIPAGTITIQ